MNILHVITTINRGGAENHLSELVAYQRSVGMSVSVAYLRGGGYWAAEFKRIGVEVFPLELSFYGDLLPVLKLSKMVKSNGYDIVHAHLPPAELYCRVALMLVSGSPSLVITKHNDCAFHRLPGERLMGRWVAARATRVITISDSVKRFVVGATLGLPSAKVNTVYYGINPVPFLKVATEARRRLRTAWGVDDGTLLVGFVGRLVDQKSIDTLLEAVAILLRRGTLDIKLVIVGQGPLEMDLRRIARRLDIERAVVWAGFREDMPECMSAFDVFALSSWFEGFGLVLVEAMAAGLPVVATRAGAIPEVVQNGTTGILVEVGRPDLFAAGIEELRDKEARLLMGEAGRRHVLEAFTLGSMFAGTDRIYAECIGAGFCANVGSDSMRCEPRRVVQDLGEQ